MASRSDPKGGGQDARSNPLTPTSYLQHSKAELPVYLIKSSDASSERVRTVRGSSHLSGTNGVAQRPEGRRAGCPKQSSHSDQLSSALQSRTTGLPYQELRCLHVRGFEPLEVRAICREQMASRSDPKGGGQDARSNPLTPTDYPSHWIPIPFPQTQNSPPACKRAGWGSPGIFIRTASAAASCRWRGAGWAGGTRAVLP